jgi:hypothetical protein
MASCIPDHLVSAETLKNAWERLAQDRAKVQALKNQQKLAQPQSLTPPSTEQIVLALLDALQHNESQMQKQSVALIHEVCETERLRRELEHARAQAQSQTLALNQELERTENLKKQLEFANARAHVNKIALAQELARHELERQTADAIRSGLAQIIELGQLPAS